MALPDLVIFDCDGVLVDSERLAVRLEAAALTELGWRLTEAQVAERFMGRSDADMLAEIERQLGAETAAGWTERIEREYEAAFVAELVPVAGVVDALDALECATCVASSATHERLRLTLGLTGLLERFDGRIFSAADVERGKPAPDLVLHAASSLGAAPERCVVVEDSPYGVLGARAAGMRVLGYDAGLVAPERLAEAGAEVFSDMRDLPRLLVPDGGDTRPE